MRAWGGCVLAPGLLFGLAGQRTRALISTLSTYKAVPGAARVARGPGLGGVFDYSSDYAQGANPLWV